MSMGVIIPAAGQGVRLRPLTLELAKELLELGGKPAIHGALLETASTPRDRLVVVVSEAKAALRAMLDAEGVRQALQQAPLGVFDAIARGRQMVAGAPYAVIFPDAICLPDQRGLEAMVSGRARAVSLADEATAKRIDEGVVFGLVQMNTERMRRIGPTVRVDVVELTCGLLQVTAVHPARPTFEGAWHTHFAEIHGVAHAGRIAAAGCDDSLLLDILRAAIAAGQFFGAPLPGELFDIGRLAGYRDAVAQFADGKARWRA